MELELVVAAEAAGSVGRLKPLLACRQGRSRNQASRIVWHDDADHALRAQGQALAETRTSWRLERLLPGSETWLPGQPAPLLAEADDPSSLPNLPATLAPLVAFEGRRSVSVHELPGGLVTLTVSHGVLRAVAAERRVERILLSGDQAAVREAALLIATAIPVSLPSATLAAEGIALATGWVPPARRTGAPELPDTARTIVTALAHIMGHLLDVLLAHLDRLDHGPEAVHQMRVAVRRARSAVSVFRSAFAPGVLEPMRLALKTLNEKLGATRDWDVLTGETLPAIRLSLPRDDRLARLAGAAERRRREHHKALDTWLRTQAFRVLIIELAWFIASDAWRQVLPLPQPQVDTGEVHPVPAELSLADFAATVLRKRWKRLLSAGKGIKELEAPALHALRLRAKRARYAAEMFSALYEGKAPHRFIRRLSVLQQRLGVMNDGAVATGLLEQLGGAGGRFGYATGVVTGFMAARAERLRPRIVVAFGKFRRQAPYWS